MGEYLDWILLESRSEISKQNFGTRPRGEMLYSKMRAQRHKSKRSTRTSTAVTTCFEKTTRNCSLVANPRRLPRQLILAQIRYASESLTLRRYRICRLRQTA